MRLGRPVRAQPMAVETPSQRRLCLESTRAGHTVKLQATSAKRGDDMVAHTKRRPDGTILRIEELPAGKNRLATLSMGPGAKDFASIAQSLLSNAQSDAGDACSAYPKPGDAQRFSRGAKQAAPAPAPGIDPEAEESAQALNDALVKFGRGAEWTNAYEAVALPDALSGIRQEIQAAFGRDVRPVAPTAAKFDIFNGAYIPSQPKTLCVYVARKPGFDQVAAHALWHYIKRSRPDLIDLYRTARCIAPRTCLVEAISRTSCCRPAIVKVAFDPK